MRYLVRHFSFAAESWISLAVIDARFYNPVQIKCLKATRLVEQFVNKLLRAVRFHL